MALANDERLAQRRRCQGRRLSPSSSLSSSSLLLATAAALTMLLFFLCSPASAATHGAVFTRDARPVVTIVPAFR